MKPHHLYLGLRSPFARRIRLAVKRLKISAQITEVNVFEPTEQFLKDNPLGTIPALQYENGMWLSDSASILEFFDQNYAPGIWPIEKSAREFARAQSTFAEGVMTNTVSHFLESQRSNPDAAWKQEYQDNIDRTLIHLESISTKLISDELTQAVLDTGIALDYLSLRIPTLTWRTRFGGLEKTLARCQDQAFFKETSPPPA